MILAIDEPICDEDNGHHGLIQRLFLHLVFTYLVRLDLETIRLQRTAVTKYLGIPRYTGFVLSRDASSQPG